MPGILATQEHQDEHHDDNRPCRRQKPRTLCDLHRSRWECLDRGVVPHEHAHARSTRSELDRDRDGLRHGGLRDPMPLDVRAVRATQVNKDPPRPDSPQLCVARTGIDVPVRIEGDLTFGVPTKPHAASRRELLPLPAPTSGDVVDDDPHAAIVSPGAEPPRNRARSEPDQEIDPAAVRGAEALACGSVGLGRRTSGGNPEADGRP